MTSGSDLAFPELCASCSILRLIAGATTPTGAMKAARRSRQPVCPIIHTDTADNITHRASACGRQTCIEMCEKSRHSVKSERASG